MLLLVLFRRGWCPLGEWFLPFRRAIPLPGRDVAALGDVAYCSCIVGINRCFSTNSSCSLTISSRRLTVFSRLRSLFSRTASDSYGSYGA